MPAAEAEAQDVVEESGAELAGAEYPRGSLACARRTPTPPRHGREIAAVALEAAGETAAG